MRIVYTGQFRCPIDTLWRHISEPELQKKWMKGLLENRPTSDGPPRPGSTFTMKIQEGPKASEYQGEVIAHEAPDHLAIRFWGGCFPADLVMRVDYRLSEAGGQTRLDYVAQREKGQCPFWMRLLLPLMVVFSKMQLRNFMKKLKGLVEPPPAAAA
jgi:hypothetical protein